MDPLQLMLYGGALGVCALVFQALLRGQMWIGKSVDALSAALVERIKRAENQVDTLLPTVDRMDKTLNKVLDELRRERVERP